MRLEGFVSGQRAETTAHLCPPLPIWLCERRSLCYPQHSMKGDAHNKRQTFQPCSPALASITPCDSGSPWTRILNFVVVFSPYNLSSSDSHVGFFSSLQLYFPWLHPGLLSCSGFPVWLSSAPCIDSKCALSTDSQQPWVLCFQMLLWQMRAQVFGLSKVILGPLSSPLPPLLPSPLPPLPLPLLPLSFWKQCSSLTFGARRPKVLESL